MNEIIEMDVKPILPVRICRAIKSGVCNALGALASRDFWLDLGAKVIREMINAFMKTLGAKFLTLAVSREDPEVKRAAAASQLNNSPAFSSSPAFGSAPSYPSAPRYGTTPSGMSGGYNNGYNSYPPAPAPQPRTDIKFPGF